MITAGWILFVAWALAQTVWYRRAHVAPDAVPAVRPAAPPRIPLRQRLASVKARPIEAAGPPLDTIDIPDDLAAPPAGVRGSVLGLG